jgi:hypothetical protein
MCAVHSVRFKEQASKRAPAESLLTQTGSNGVDHVYKGLCWWALRNSSVLAIAWADMGS